jgi:hypothetical protein
MEDFSDDPPVRVPQQQPRNGDPLASWTKPNLVAQEVVKIAGQ